MKIVKSIYPGRRDSLTNKVAVVVVFLFHISEKIIKAKNIQPKGRERFGKDDKVEDRSS